MLALKKIKQNKSNKETIIFHKKEYNNNIFCIIMGNFQFHIYGQNTYIPTIRLIFVMFSHYIIIVLSAKLIN